jgi:hypothetical protein
MRADVADDLAVIRSWRDVQPPSDTREAMVAGFLWALALVAEIDVTDLRARLDSPRRGEDAFRPAVPVTAPAGPLPLAPVGPEGTAVPPWPGLGIARIPRTQEASDGPLSPGRAFTAGPDGRPVRLAASYAEMAADSSAETRGLSDDTATPETRADVSTGTTT